MQRVTYQGPHLEGVVVPVHDEDLVIRPGDTTEFEDDVAEGLLIQGHEHVLDPKTGLAAYEGDGEARRPMMRPVEGAKPPWIRAEEPKVKAKTSPAPAIEEALGGETR